MPVGKEARIRSGAITSSTRRPKRDMHEESKYPTVSTFGMGKENVLLYWIIVILVILILLGFVFGRGRMF